jgi:hypothetical protein
MSDRSNIFVIGLPAGVVIIIAIFVVISFVTHNPHWLNRGGALVAACAAGAILVQIILEIDFERRRHALENRGAKTAPPSSVVEELGLRLYEHRLKQQGSNLTKNGLRLQRLSSCVRCSGSYFTALETGRLRCSSPLTLPTKGSKRGR